MKLHELLEILDETVTAKIIHDNGTVYGAAEALLRMLGTDVLDTKVTRVMNEDGTLWIAVVEVETDE